MCLILKQFGSIFLVSRRGTAVAAIVSFFFAGAMEQELANVQTSSSSTDVEHGSPTRGRSPTPRPIDGNPTDHKSLAYGQIGLLRRTIFLEAITVKST